MKQQSGVSSTSYRRRALTFRDAFLAGITPDDLTDIARAVVQRAKDGDLKAARLVLERFVGAQPLCEWPSVADVERAELFNGL
ncbi:MAG TPA: hypothetical protein VFM14_02100 [Gemmatimonadales bacterium]|nr:hypothetical protein [Gemmatimonadales bacterium]